MYENRVISHNDNFSSVFFFNYGNGYVTLLDNITIGPGEGFTWENQPVGGAIVLIDDDIVVSFEDAAIEPGEELVKNLLVTKVYYTIES